MEDWKIGRVEGWILSESRIIRITRITRKGYWAFQVFFTRCRDFSEPHLQFRRNDMFIEKRCTTLLSSVGTAKKDKHSVPTGLRGVGVHIFAINIASLRD